MERRDVAAVVHVLREASDMVAEEQPPAPPPECAQCGSREGRFVPHPCGGDVLKLCQAHCGVLYSSLAELKWVLARSMRGSGGAR